MQLFRVVVSWTGPSIRGNAVTVLHFDGSNQSAPPAAGAIANAWGSTTNLFPAGTVVTIPGTGDTIDDTTGDLVGTWNSGASVQVTGNGAATAAAGVGACITWTTGGIVTGASGKPRRLRGRTFLVPLGSDRFQSDGTLSDAALAQVNTFATDLQACGPLAVWHRPTTKGGSNGTSYGVLSYKVRDHVAVLRSRRD